MSAFHQLIHAGVPRQPSLDEALAGPIARDVGQGISNPEPATPVAFGDLVDLMRSTTSNGQDSEICEECKTLNRRGACYCKTCRHRLPAYFASANPRAPVAIWRWREREENRTSALDLIAVCVVLIVLVLMTAHIPVG
ncbi:MAG: hypothetical protein J7605_21505 [Variovorax sp.]|nr:hypothetical protein [Variovorax sp.]